MDQIEENCGDCGQEFEDTYLCQIAQLMGMFGLDCTLSCDGYSGVDGAATVGAGVSALGVVALGVVVAL